MNDITKLLHGLKAGESGAAEQLMPLVYHELRQIARSQMAREKPGHTLQPTALVHEAWLRMVDTEGKADFTNRAHFFSVAAQAMRCLLIDAARRRLSKRNGGDQRRENIDDVEIAISESDERVLAVHEALERFSAIEPEKAEVVKLRFFAGMTIEEISETLGISQRTIGRHWEFAKAWLFGSLAKSEEG